MHWFRPAADKCFTSPKVPHSPLSDGGCGLGNMFVNWLPTFANYMLIEKLDGRQFICRHMLYTHSLGDPTLMSSHILAANSTGTGSIPARLG